MTTNATMARTRLQSADGKDRFGLIFQIEPDKDLTLVRDLPPFIFQLSAVDFVGLAFRHFANSAMLEWRSLLEPTTLLFEGEEFSPSDVSNCAEMLPRSLKISFQHPRPASAPDCAVEFYARVPGRYHCGCIRCASLFLGDKRAIVCPDCQLPPWLIFGYHAARQLDKVLPPAGDTPFDRGNRDVILMREIQEHYLCRNRPGYGNGQQESDKCVAEHRNPQLNEG